MKKFYKIIFVVFIAILLATITTSCSKNPSLEELISNPDDTIYLKNNLKSFNFNKSTAYEQLINMNHYDSKLDLNEYEKNEITLRGLFLIKIEGDNYNSDNFGFGVKWYCTAMKQATPLTEISIILDRKDKKIYISYLQYDGYYDNHIVDMTDTLSINVFGILLESDI